MKCLIYQYWDGTPSSECLASTSAMKEYANRIGADHLFERDPKYVTGLGKYSPHYGQFKVVFDKSFDQYDKILFTDTDVFPTENLEENIFDEIEDKDIAIVEEWQQIEVRKKHTVAGINHANDKIWARVVESKWDVTLPKAECGSVKAYNSGVVLWSRKGINKARTRFVPFQSYVSMINFSGLPVFYTCDQPYIHAMLEVAGLNWKELDYKWNSSVHYVPGTKEPRPVNDLREGRANFVHVQLAGANRYNAEKLSRIVNLPVEQWNL